ncbi:MAG: hypothetical protein IM638_09765 [Bacteroidetes bacterium]|nr:hypothetical protein [Bacteroidota bacterium]
MTKKLTLTLFLLVGITIPCFAGGIKGDLIPDELLWGALIWFILAHVLGIIGFITRTLWVRVIAGLLYGPVLLVPLLLGFLYLPLALLAIPPILFFVFLIIRQKK